MRAEEAAALFDRHAATYDSVNRVISIGLDRRWRSWAVDRAISGGASYVLDAMAGAGEIAVEVARAGRCVLAVDVSPGMLSAARERAARSGVHIRTMLADVAAAGSLAPHGFDSAVLSFGLRYADDKPGLLRAIAASLHPGGKLVLLEFCTPPRSPLSAAASLYFFRLLPLVASALGSGPDLYRVLTDSTREIGTAEQIVALAESAGLVVRERRVMGFGLVLGLVLTPA